MQLVEVRLELADGAGFGGGRHAHPDSAQLNARHALHGEHAFFVVDVGEFQGNDTWNGKRRLTPHVCHSFSFATQAVAGSFFLARLVAKKYSLNFLDWTKTNFSHGLRGCTCNNIDFLCGKESSEMTNGRGMT